MPIRLLIFAAQQITYILLMIRTSHPLLQQFLDAIGSLPGVRIVEPTQENQKIVLLEIAGRLVKLDIEIKKSIYPRDVKQLYWPQKLGRKISSEQEVGEPTLPFLIAEAISPTAKEVLKEVQASFFDSGGSMYFQSGDAYIWIEKPPPKPMERSIRSVYQGKSGQVIRTLLGSKLEWFNVKTLAKLAGVSTATVSQVLTELGRFEWIDLRGSGPKKEQKLRNPGALLDALVKETASTTSPIPTLYSVPHCTTSELLVNLGVIFEAQEIQYAISYTAAAQRYLSAPSKVSQVRLRVVTGQSIDFALSLIGAQPVKEGANLALIKTESSDEMVLKERVDGVWLVNPIQVYLDLLGHEVWAKEIAEKYRTERFGF